MNTPLSPELFQRMNAYWRAANYLSVGQIYLYDNPLLKTPLSLDHIKPRLLGHWGTTPGLNLIYGHLNRIIKQFDLNMIYVTGPGHGGPGLVANTYLEGTQRAVSERLSRRAGAQAAVHPILAICSPGGKACFRAMRRSFTSLIRCSINTPNGSTSADTFRGDDPSHR